MSQVAPRKRSLSIEPVEHHPDQAIDQEGSKIKKQKMDDEQSLLEQLPKKIRESIFEMCIGSIGSLRLTSQSHCELVSEWARPDNLPRVETIKIAFTQLTGKSQKHPIRVEVRIQQHNFRYFVRLIALMEKKEEYGINVVTRHEKNKCLLFTFSLPLHSPVFALLGASLSTRVGAIALAFNSETHVTRRKPHKDWFTEHPRKYMTPREAAIEEKEMQERWVAEGNTGHWNTLPAQPITEHRSMPYCSDFDDLLGGIEEAGTVTVDVTDFCSRLGDLVLMLVAKCGVKRVKLSTGFNVMEGRPSDFLFSLATLVDNIELGQPEPEVCTEENIFFGILGEDWAELVMEMFARGATRLTLDNRGFLHLTQQQVKSICEEIAAQQLPVFFRTTYKGQLELSAPGYEAKEVKSKPKSISFRHESVPVSWHAEF